MEGLDKYINSYLRSGEFRSLLDKDFSINFPVTIAYAIEKLIVAHVKMYMMEDTVRDTSLSDDQIGKLKRKIDQINGVYRPMLVSALGDMLAKAVKEANLNLVQEPSTKKYG